MILTRCGFPYGAPGGAIESAVGAKVLKSQQSLNKPINRLLKPFGLSVLRHKKLAQFCALELDIGELFSLLDRSFGSGSAKSQIRQDLFVLLQTGFQRDGYFVEFGATNGVDLSNTYLLETRFGWQGIVAEPARLWHDDLRRNRKAHVELDCVWKTTGDELLFNESRDPELSRLSQFNDVGRHSAEMTAGEPYTVKTVSLVDLLKRHGAPKEIDYLSIDTEGSEFEILRAFDFDAYTISIITCEHNHTPDRGRIFDLLTSKGYRRVFESISQWDDWYVLSN